MTRQPTYRKPRSNQLRPLKLLRRHPSQPGSRKKCRCRRRKKKSARKNHFSPASSRHCSANQSLKRVARQKMQTKDVENAVPARSWTLPRPRNPVKKVVTSVEDDVQTKIARLRIRGRMWHRFRPQKMRSNRKTTSRPLTSQNDVHAIRDAAPAVRE